MEFVFRLLCGFQLPYFFIGLIAITLISFLDDVLTLDNKIRLLVHLSAVLMLFYQWNLFALPWYWLIIGLIFVIGIINAYNFMDGINGITGGHSTIVVLALWFVNHYHLKFIENDFLVFTLLGLMVFNYFNFRTKARCFAGDVGSISIAVVILFLLLKLILQEQNLIYILFLSVYGVDSILTIIHRLFLKENIFKAHRLHLFQVIVHNLKIPHLLMSSIYMLIQGVICSVIIFNLRYSLITQFIIGFSMIIILLFSYIIIKRNVMVLTVK